MWNATTRNVPDRWLMAAETTMTTASPGAANAQEMLLTADLCTWTSQPWICYTTVVPIGIWICCVVIAVVVLCFRTAVGKEYQRLTEWSDGSLVPESLKSLHRKRRERIFQKLRSLPLQRMFQRLKLDPAFAESCAAAGIATLGDLLVLRPVFLRDLGFGVTEKQHIMRAIERRAQLIEEMHRVRDDAIVMDSGVPSEVVEATVKNTRAGLEWYILKPCPGALRRHASLAQGARWEAQLAQLPSETNDDESDELLLSEQVSSLFWAFLRAEYAERTQEAVEPPLISIAADNKRSALLSRRFYLQVRNRWEVARSRLLLIRVNFISTFKRVSVKHQPRVLLVNEQFWLGFVLKWNLQEKRAANERAIELAQKEAKERLKTLQYESQLAASRLWHEDGGKDREKPMSPQEDVVPAHTTAGLRERLGSFLSPMTRVLQLKAMQQSAAMYADETVSAAHANGGDAQNLVRSDSESSSWSFVETGDRRSLGGGGRDDDGNSIDVEEEFQVINDDDVRRATQEDDGIELVDGDHSVEDRNRANLLEMDPFAEGWEMPTSMVRSMNRETFAVSVSLVRYLKPEEYGQSPFVLDNVKLAEFVGSRASEGDLMEELAQDVDYVTAVPMWNAFVHEFQLGEMAIMRVPRDEHTAFQRSPTMNGGEDEDDITTSAQEMTDIHAATNLATPMKRQEAKMSSVDTVSRSSARGTYVPPVSNILNEDNGLLVEMDSDSDPQFLTARCSSSVHTVSLHIVSMTNTTERFAELRRQLARMRDPEVLRNWRDEQAHQRQEELLLDAGPRRRAAQSPTLPSYVSTSGAQNQTSATRTNRKKRGVSGFWKSVV